MRRSLLTIAALAIALAASAPAAAHPGLKPPPHSHAFGGSLVNWQKRWFGWVFGSSANPFETGICGERVGRMFFLTAALEPGTEVDCHLRPGTPLLASPGGAITWPNPGDTPAILPADVKSAFAEGVFSDPAAALDGRSLGNLDPALRLTDVYTIPLEPGNFIQSVDPDNPEVAGDHAQVASGGWFLRITPLRPGQHTLVLLDRIEGDLYDITFHITVGHCGRRGHR